MQQKGIPPALAEVSTRPSSIMSQRAGEADPCRRYMGKAVADNIMKESRVGGRGPARSFVEALAAIV